VIDYRPPILPLFPYTTLFRSRRADPPAAPEDRPRRADRHDPFDRARPDRLGRAGRGVPRGLGGTRLAARPVDRGPDRFAPRRARSEEHTSELQSLAYLVCRLL